MRMLAPGNGIPQVNECVKGKESRSGQRGRARQAIDANHMTARPATR